MSLTIGNRLIGAPGRTYVIAEMSANHHQDLDQAVAIIKAAKNAGADAVKLQTYTPDTMTIDSDKDCFRIQKTIWAGATLYDLYGDACTPWEWHPNLKAEADRLGIDLFSTPFDPTAVDFLEKVGVPAYKVASFELVDLPLLKKIGRTGKPVILSTGMATLAEIDEAVRTIREAGSGGLALLKCTSAYPAPPEEMHLKTIPHLASAFDVPVGLSDHTLGIAVPVAAVALGAAIIEKHFTLSRSVTGPDSAFSLEPEEFKAMVDEIRIAEKALGRVNYQLTEAEAATRVFRRSLFVVRDMKAGERFSHENVRVIRPGHGLAPKFIDKVIGKKAAADIDRGTPLDWELIG